MKKSMRAALYDGLAKFVGVSDEECKELRREIDQSSDEECHVMRSMLETLELAHRAVGSAKIRNVLQRKWPRQEGVRFLAKWASHDLKASRRLISEAAKKEDKLFFITLGKCLSGEIKEDSDRLNFYVAWIVCENPSITAKDAVRELKERGGWALSEDYFRMMKKRLGLSGPVCKRAAQSRKA